MLASSVFFDSSYYLAENPDVAAAKVDPIDHYLSRGATEGRKPHPLFDPAWYLSNNPDVAAAGVNPLVHYLRQGWKEQRTPHPLLLSEASSHDDLAVGSGLHPGPLFDSRWYAQQHPEIDKAGLNPLAQYVRYGWKHGWRPHILFDEQWCAAQALQSTGLDPLTRYVSEGWRTMSTPSPLFDPNYYLAQNPDIAVAGVSPLEHYLSTGWHEGRNPHPLFDSDWYLSTYGEASNSALSPLVHYASRGMQEGRQPNSWFDPAFYVRQTGNRPSAIANPILDYLARGAAEGLDPHPTFDSAWYLSQHPQIEKSGLNPLAHYLTTGRTLALKTSERRKIVFISGEVHTPGHRYRVLNQAAALPLKSYEAVIVDAAQLGQDKSVLSGADIFWLWRMSWSEVSAEIVGLARNQGTKIIFDVDDLMFRPELAKKEIIDGIRTQSLIEEEVEQFYARVQAVLLKADHCTVPTSVLRDELREFRKPTTVIPNGFDRTVLAASKLALYNRSLESDNSIVRIGYAAGSRTHQRDLGVAAKALAKVLKRFAFTRLLLYKGQVTLDEFPELEALGEQIEWRELVPPAALPHEYARFDINIAPLEVGNRFCEAKSELKYFEAALVEIPTIASPTVPFRNAIRHGETGYLAASHNDWCFALTELITNPAKRKQVGEQAKREVLWLYGPERRTLLSTRLIDRLLAPPEYKSQLIVQTTRAEEHEFVPPIPLPGFDVVFESGRRGLSRVSVVIPLFNYEHFLPEALGSVLDQQSVDGLDLIVADDRSIDKSRLVAEEWLNKNASHFNFVALLQNRQNSKLGYTRNAAVNYCDTEFFLPLDPDNLLLPDCVAELQKLLDWTGAAFAYPIIELFGNRVGIEGNAEFDPAAFLFGNYIDAMAMVRRACWSAVGGYEPLDPPGWEDYDFWCKFVEKGFVGTGSKRILAKYRAHGNSMLFTATDLPANKAEVLREMSRRHPWLQLHGASQAN